MRITRRCPYVWQEADQRATLRQASDQEFERYVTHAHMKIRAPMREERSGKTVAEKPAAAAPVAPATPQPAAPAPAQRPAAPQPSAPPSRPAAPPPPPRRRSRADELLGTSPLSAR